MEAPCARLRRFPVQTRASVRRLMWAATNERMEEMRRLAENDPHTLLAYITISGNGLRILFRYEPDTALTLEQRIRFYRKAFLTANRHYAALLGIKPDGQCKNVTRLSGICHAPNIFFNPSATPFTAKWIEEAELGFERKKQGSVRGFIVVPRSGEEISGYQKALALHALSDHAEEVCGTDGTDRTDVL